MTPQAAAADSHTLRAQLMAPNPMDRAIALHALEVELERNRAGHRCPIAGQAEKFAARGIPFYSPQDPHFCEWVGKAVGYWEALHRANTATVAA